ELTYKAKLGADSAGLALTAIAILANALTLVAAAWVAWKPFFGAPRDRSSPDVPRSMWLGPLILAALGVCFGAYPKALVALVEPAMTAVAGTPLEAKLSLWYGPGPALTASLVTFALGIAAWLMRLRIRAVLQHVAARLPVAEQVHDAIWGALLAFAAALSRVLLRLDLRHVLLLLLGTTLAGSAWALLSAGWIVPQWEVTASLELVVIGAAAFGATAAAWTQSRERALVYVGLVGACVAVLFLAAGAPDLAITLALVEALFLVVALTTLRKLPKARYESRATKVRDALVAVGLGSVLTLATWALLASPLPAELLRQYATLSVPEGHGRNVVNVILVDFRALDTLGEIAVLGIAAVATLGLMGPRALFTAPQLGTSRRLSAAARVLGPVLLVLSVWLLLRGHNQPGGGFIGGLVAAAAWLTAGLAGAKLVQRGPKPEVLVGIGLVVALGSGLIAFTQADAFMTGQWIHLATVPLGTPLLFDVGVYLAVLGFARTVLERLGLSRPAEV
ncbi:MAG TPA: MnhB domain-containing protein, partial [Polyangiaceae bacterium]|nr:MnhB domain-containing protein [Polyangiaceae bacterium]